MSTNFDDTVQQGYVKLKSKTVGTWQRKWVILKKSSSRGPRRLEKYTDEKSSLIGHGCKQIDLSHMSEIAKLPPDMKKHTLAISCLDGTSRQLSFDSDLETNRWLEALNNECKKTPRDGTWSPHTANKVFCLRPHSFSVFYTGGIVAIQMQGYRNISAMGCFIHVGVMNYDTFNVYLLPSPNLSVYGESLLLISDTNLEILDIDDSSKKLVSWPLASLRRYGRDESKFTFESGRFCQTGEGLFVFNTTQGDKIYQMVHSATVAIAEAIRVTKSVETAKEKKTPMLSKSLSAPNPTKPEDRQACARLARTGEESFDASGAPPVPPRTRPRPLPLLPQGEKAAGEYAYLDEKKHRLPTKSVSIDSGAAAFNYTGANYHDSSPSGSGQQNFGMRKGASLDVDVPSLPPPPPPLRPEGADTSQRGRRHMLVRQAATISDGNNNYALADKLSTVQDHNSDSDAEDYELSWVGASTTNKSLSRGAESSREAACVKPAAPAACNGDAKTCDNHNNEHNEMIYEENYLEGDFRKYLATRKT